MDLKIFVYISSSCSSNFSTYTFFYWRITGSANETARGAYKTPRHLPSCFFIWCFAVSVTPSIYTPDSSDDLMIWIILISSFEINKLNSLPTLTASFPLIFLSNLYIAFEALHLNCLLIQVNCL